QLQNSAANGGSAGSLIEASGKSLTLNGAGFAGNGALENTIGINTWGSSPVTLASNSPLGVDDTSTLSISQAIGDSGAALGITKVGTGTLQYTGGSANSNTYTGLTNVTAGTLNLSKTGGGTAIAGNLAVGNTTYLQETQTLTFNNFNPGAGDHYTLTFGGQT